MTKYCKYVGLASSNLDNIQISYIQCPGFIY